MRMKSSKLQACLQQCLKPVVAAAALCCLLQVPVAQAFDQRFYAGFSGGSSQLEPDTDPSVFELRDNNGQVGSAFFGWDFSPRWTLEGYYSDLGSARVFQPGLAIAGSEIVEYRVAGVSALAYFFSLSDAAGLISRRGLSLFGGAGVGYLETSSNAPIRQLEEAHILLTAGMEYGTRSGLAARLQFDGHDVDAWSARLGLLFRFGGSRVPSVETVDETPELPASTETQAYQTAAATDIIQPLTDPGIPAAAIAADETVYGPAYLDTDNDGVVDTHDVCSSTAYGSPVNATGCPLFEGRLVGLTFNSGSADLGSGARQLLDEAAAKLLLHPRVRIAVQAHTDNKGSAAGNLRLSKKRALEVSRYLVSRGVEKTRIEAQAYGESRPVASNANDASRQLNRRIEFTTL